MSALIWSAVAMMPLYAPTMVGEWVWNLVGPSTVSRVCASRQYEFCSTFSLPSRGRSTYSAIRGLLVAPLLDL